MANLLIVTDQTSDWQQYFPSEQVVDVAQYLDSDWQHNQRSVQVVNLCRDYGYMSSGYYCFADGWCTWSSSHSDGDRH